MTDSDTTASRALAAGAAMELKSKREAELEEIRQKHLAKTWKDQHGNTVSPSLGDLPKVDETTAAAVSAAIKAKAGSAAIKTMDDFNMEQRRRTEESRRYQADAVNSLHKYRGTVDEKELQRRALAEENRRKQLEAADMLHKYRGSADGVKSPSRKAKDSIVADVRAGERKDDVFSSELLPRGFGNEQSKEAIVGTPTKSAQRDAVIGGDNYVSDAEKIRAPLPDAIVGDLDATQDTAPPKGEEKKDDFSPSKISSEVSALSVNEVNVDTPNTAAADTEVPSTVSQDAWEDEMASSSAPPTGFDRGASSLSITEERSNMMRHNIDFSFGLITTPEEAPPTGSFSPTESHSNANKGITGNVQASSVLGRLMLAAEIIVQTALLKREGESGQFNEKDPFSERKTVEGIVYDPDYAPFVVEVVDDVFYEPSPHRRGTVRRFIRAMIPIFIRRGHVEMTEGIRNDIIDALRMACANGTFSDAADRPSAKGDIF